MERIERAAPNYTALQCQLLLACLSTQFRGCGYIPNLCDDGKIVGDLVYAIRNPRSYATTHEAILETARSSASQLKGR